MMKSINILRAIMKVGNSITKSGSAPAIVYKNFINDLQRAAASYFANKGAPTDERANYSLQSPDLWSRNIICNDVVAYIRGEHPRRRNGKSLPLHRYIHHGLSSQAMLFNLVGPLIVRNDLEPLRTVLAEIGISWPENDLRAEFEYTDTTVFDEDPGHATSFDVAIVGCKNPIFIEAKLAERGFGGCSAYPRQCDGRNRAAEDYSRCYLHRKGRRYWPLMDHYDIMDEEMAGRSECPFVENYQFYRELLFALVKGGSFILLCDERNPVFTGSDPNERPSGGLWHNLLASLPQTFQKNLGLITVQQVVRTVKKTGRHDVWINDFVRKYGLGDSLD
jgi:POLQ-like helicase